MGQLAVASVDLAPLLGLVQHGLHLPAQQAMDRVAPRDVVVEGPGRPPGLPAPHPAPVDLECSGRYPDRIPDLGRVDNRQRSHEDGDTSKWKEQQMRKRLLAFAGIVAVCGLASVQPALAHAGHRSCGDGAALFNPSKGETANIVRPVAQAGEMGDFEASVHYLFCDPAE